MTEQFAKSAAPSPEVQHKSYFLDQEFSEDGKTIELIQIALVCDDGREYEAICSEYDYFRASDWVREHVIRPLFNRIKKSSPRVREIDGKWWFTKPLADGTVDYPIDETNFHTWFGRTVEQIRSEILYFTGCKPVQPKEGDTGIRWKLPEHKKVRFYAYYADYDWVRFCQIFGRMIDLPEGFPMYCRDLKQELDRLAENIYPEASTQEALARIRKWKGWPVQDDDDEHDALQDARWNKALHNFMVNINFLNPDKRSSTFQEALTDLINRYNMEHPSDTPDFVLANFLFKVLGAWSGSVQERDMWFGIKPWDGKKEKRAPEAGGLTLTDSEENLIRDLRRAKSSPGQVQAAEHINEQVDKAAENLPWLSYEQLSEKMDTMLFGPVEQGDQEIRFLVSPANEQQRWYMQRPTPKFHPEQKVIVPVKEGDTPPGPLASQVVGGCTVKGLTWSNDPGWSWVYLLEFTLREDAPYRAGETMQSWVPEQRLRVYAPVGIQEQLPEDVQQKINNKAQDHQQ